MLVNELAKAVSGRMQNVPDNIRIDSLCIDSRKIENGCMFVAVNADRDGHDYIGSAIANGSPCVLASDTDKAVRYPAIIVNNTIEALARLGKYCRDKFTGNLIAVTGSVGKTSTKDALAAVFNGFYPTFKTPGNLNNELGLPMTLFQLSNSYHTAIIELGMNHQGEMSRLSAIARPTSAVFTNISDTHIENFDSRESIMQAKAEMLPYLPDGADIFINGDDPLLVKMQNENNRLHFITAGTSENCDFLVTDITPLGLRGVRFNITHKGITYSLTCPIPGVHTALNCALAFAAGFVFSIPYENMRNSIKALTGGKMRWEVTTAKINNGEITLINDAYNASPLSVASAIQTLKSSETKGRKIAVLGDMLELGEISAVSHSNNGILAEGLDMLIAIGAMSENTAITAKSLGVPTLYFKDVPSALSAIRQSLLPFDTVLLKASRGMAFERIAEYIGQSQ